MAQELSVPGIAEAGKEIMEEGWQEGSFKGRNR